MHPPAEPAVGFALGKFVSTLAGLLLRALMKVVNMVALAAAGIAGRLSSSLAKGREAHVSSGRNQLADSMAAGR